MPVLKVSENKPPPAVNLIEVYQPYLPQMICHVGHDSWLVCNCTDARLMRIRDMGLSVYDRSLDKIRELI